MRRLIVSILTVSVAIASPLVSQLAHGKETFNQVAAVAKVQLSQMVSGEVLSVDDEWSKIVIKHQELEDLGMPAMTMVFNVPEKSLLKGVRVGDKIKFGAQVAPSGLSVVRLERESN